MDGEDRVLHRAWPVLRFLGRWRGPRPLLPLDPLFRAHSGSGRAWWRARHPARGQSGPLSPRGRDRGATAPPPGEPRASPNRLLCVLRVPKLCCRPQPSRRKPAPQPGGWFSVVPTPLPPWARPLAEARSEVLPRRDDGRPGPPSDIRVLQPEVSAPRRWSLPRPRPHAPALAVLPQPPPAGTHLHSRICRSALPSSLPFRHSSMDWMAASVDAKVGSGHAPSTYRASAAMAAVASFRFLFKSLSSLDMFSSCERTCSRH